jgi:hypothetical protein
MAKKVSTEKVAKSGTQKAIESQGQVHSNKEAASKNSAVEAAKQKVADAKMALHEAQQAHATAVAEASAIIRQPGWSNSKPESEQVKETSQTRQTEK